MMAAWPDLFCFVSNTISPIDGKLPGATKHAGSRGSGFQLPDAQLFAVCGFAPDLEP